MARAPLLCFARLLCGASWLNPLMKLGWHKPLEQTDLPPLPTWDDAKEISVGFADAWEAERQKPT